MTEQKQKSFWSRPEGVTGAIFLAALIFGIGYITLASLGALLSFMTTTIGAFISLMVMGTVIFMALDGKTRTLVSYMYKSAMRWITGLFVQIDPIGILKSYVEDLKSNLTKMNRQIAQLRGQMHKLQEIILNNKKEIIAIKQVS